MAFCYFPFVIGLGLIERLLNYLLEHFFILLPHFVSIVGIGRLQTTLNSIIQAEFLGVSRVMEAEIQFFWWYLCSWCITAVDCALLIYLLVLLS